jgi:hypothetical protein
MLHPCLPRTAAKNFVALGLRKITVIIKAVVEAVEQDCVDVAFGFCIGHCFEPENQSFPRKYKRFGFELS